MEKFKLNPSSLPTISLILTNGIATLSVAQDKSWGREVILDISEFHQLYLQNITHYFTVPPLILKSPQIPVVGLICSGRILASFSQIPPSSIWGHSRMKSHRLQPRVNSEVSVSTCSII